MEYRNELHQAAVTNKKCAVCYDNCVAIECGILLELIEAERKKLRCCGNCANGDRTGSPRRCDGCHGFNDLEDLRYTCQHFLRWEPKTK